MLEESINQLLRYLCLKSKALKMAKVGGSNFGERRNPLMGPWTFECLQMYETKFLVSFGIFCQRRGPLSSPLGHDFYNKSKGKKQSQR